MPRLPAAGALRVAAAATAATAAALALAACGSSSGPAHAAPPSTPATGASTVTTTAPTTVATTTTAPDQPSAPRPSADDAATALLEAWADGNRTQAAEVASPAAVATLFAVPYPGQSLQARGCSGTFSPEVCTYRDGNDLVEVNATQVPAGWYVSTVTVES